MYRSRYRAMTLIYGIVAMSALMMIVSLGVDLGHVQLVKTELQSAADAAARAAASQVGIGTAAAQNAAISAAAANKSDGSSITITAQDVSIGNWNSTTKTFTPGGSPSNAVRVSMQKDVGLHFARVLGINTFRVDDVQAISLATSNNTGYGLVGLNGVTLNGNVVTDSYSSAAGAYSAGTAGENGSLASNGSISLNSSTVNGDLYMKTGQTLNSNSSTYGTRINSGTDLSFPTPSAGTYSSSNNNNLVSPSNAISGPNFNVNNGTVTIPSGNYYFTHFHANSARINVTGAATIHVNGNVFLNSATFSVAGNLPSNLTIKVVKTNGPNFTINSVPDLWADIQTPNGDVTFNSGTNFYGRIISRTLSVNSNAQLHVDTSLPAISGASAPSGGGSSVVSIVD